MTAMLTMLFINDLNGYVLTVRGFPSVLLAVVKHEVSEIHAHILVICLRAICLGGWRRRVHVED